MKQILIPFFFLLITNIVGHTQGNNLSDFIPEGYTEYSRDSQDLNNDGQDDCFLIIKKMDRNRHGVLALFKNDKNYERIIPNVLNESINSGWYFKILGGGSDYDFVPDRTKLNGKKNNG